MRIAGAASCASCAACWCKLQMLHSTLLYCAAALVAAKSRGGPSWTAAQREQFATNGYVLQPDVIRPEDRDALVAAFERLFRGDFDTGCYPDEWHWREGISKPDAFREIVNAWKSDDSVAAVALEAAIGKRAAELMGWRGARLAQDDVLWKPPGASGVSYHTDGKYISDNFVPRDDNSVTVWIALDNADEATGVVEYARGSHRWPRATSKASFHDGAGADPVTRAAAAAGVELVVDRHEVSACSAVFHHQDVWHGSAANRSPDRPRRALGLHYIRDDVRFRRDPDYIYGRYDLGDGVVQDAFFPRVYPASPAVARRLGLTVDRRRSSSDASSGASS